MNRGVDILLLRLIKSKNVMVPLLVFLISCGTGASAKPIGCWGIMTQNENKIGQCEGVGYLLEFRDQLYLEKSLESSNRPVFLVSDRDFTLSANRKEFVGKKFSFRANYEWLPEDIVNFTKLEITPVEDDQKR